LLIFTKIAELQDFLNKQRELQKSIGFVPTMGALHQGHISLIETSKNFSDLTVCSIFVNPTQFNDKLDLERYPRTPEADTELLGKAGCDVLFLPNVTEIYPKETKENFDFGHLDHILEGRARPNHFNGVAQVVKRFFEIIKPSKAFFGSKDFQQVMVIKSLVRQMNSPIQIIACPILRENDGLAMSSRNTLLTTQEREAAKIIPYLMKNARKMALEVGVSEAKAWVDKEVKKESLFKLDYFEVCDTETLKILNEVNNPEKTIALIALFVGRIRLIDNL
jgi:pantoate--beta-alanine ligase